MTDRILVSGHARERAATRAGIGVGLVFHEVKSALANGRMACNAPPWISDIDHHRRRADKTRSGGKRGHVRWVWPPEETRAYLVCRKAGRWVVITVVAASAEVASVA